MRQILLAMGLAGAILLTACGPAIRPHTSCFNIRRFDYFRKLLHPAPLPHPVILANLKAFIYPHYC